VPRDQLLAGLTPRLSEAVSAADLEKLDLHLPKEDFLPAEVLERLTLDPETIMVKGVEVQVVYEVVSSSCIRATMSVSAADVDKLSASDFPIPKKATEAYFMATAEDGSPITSSHSWIGLQCLLADRKRRQQETQEREAKWAAERAAGEERDRRLEAVEKRITNREVADLPTGNLRQLYREAEWAYGGRQSELIVQLENMLGKLESTGVSEQLLDSLMGQSWWPTLRGQVDAAAIRSDGFFESPTEEQVRGYCLQRLGELNIETVDDLWRWRLSLIPQVHDYVDKGMMAELQAMGDLAPATVEIAGRKSATAYPVIYSYEGEGDGRVATGRIALPLSVYERNAAEHGKPSALPKLPFGIKLVIEVTHDGKTIATGEDGADLQTKITKYKRGRSRSRNTVGGDLL
jgi:hypothetical protein